MKIPLRRSLSCLLLLLAASLVALLGCDNNSGVDGAGGVAGSSSGFIVSPQTLEVADGDTTGIFRATGGDEPLVWTVSDVGLGNLTPADGRIVNYTVNTGTNSIAQGRNIVSVTDANGNRASATVTHDTLVVSPANVILTGTNETAIFTVTGGISPFFWSVERPNLGSVQTTSGRNAVYQRSGDSVGITSIQVRDGKGSAARAAIEQRALPVVSSNDGDS